MTQPSKPKSQSVRCNNCGHDNLPDAELCIICDTPLTNRTRFQRETKKPSGLLPPTEEEQQEAKRAEERKKAEEERLSAEEEQRRAEEEQIRAIEKKRTDELAKKAEIIKTSTICPDCGFSNRIGDLFCQDCGANLSSTPKKDSPADITQEMKALTMKELQAEIERQRSEGVDTFDSQLIYVSPAQSATSQPSPVQPETVQPPPAQPKVAQTASVQPEAVEPPPTQSKVAQPSPMPPIPTIKSIEVGDIPEGCFQFTSEMFLRFTDLESLRYTEIAPSKDKPLLVGRSHESLPVQPDVDFTPFLVEQHGVSRRHALIRLRDLRLEVQDLNSTNGTGINGFRFRPKETHQLRSGDIMTLGRVSVKVDFLRKKAPRSGNITDKLDG